MLKDVLIVTAWCVCSDDGCEAVSEEVLEEQLCFILSREYAALLGESTCYSFNEVLNL